MAHAERKKHWQPLDRRARRDYIDKWFLSAGRPEVQKSNQQGGEPSIHHRREKAGTRRLVDFGSYGAGCAEFAHNHGLRTLDQLKHPPGNPISIDRSDGRNGSRPVQSGQQPAAPTHSCPARRAAVFLDPTRTSSRTENSPHETSILYASFSCHLGRDSRCRRRRR
jgi:hypothetical protein